MPAVMRAAAVVEKAGVPSVAIGATGFDSMGRAIGRALGIRHVPIVVYPGGILTDTSETFREKIRDFVAPQVARALTARIDPETGSGTGKSSQTEPEPRDVVISGSLDDIQAAFIERQWSDGLPIMPPTIERVERFLRWTDSEPGEVIGLLLPERREATVWNVAVNGAMAGCRPEYMPVLLAIVHCLADPKFRIEDAGSTPGWEPLVVLSGPLVEELNFNSGTGALRVGRQANTSIGRFVRLYMRNVAGLRIPPGSTDQGAIASGFNVVLAENEPATSEIGWPTYRSDRGYRDDQSVVSLQSVVSTSAPIYTGGDRADDHLETITSLLVNAMGPWAFTGVTHQAWYPLLVMGPSVAHALAGFGLSKDDIRHHLYENAKISAKGMERYAWQVGSTSFNLAERVKEGLIPPDYALSEDPERLVRMIPKAEWIGIVIAGNPGRNQSRAFVNNHSQGASVTRAVELPGAWQALRAQAGGRS
jgi:hypothetical protein